MTLAEAIAVWGAIGAYAAALAASFFALAFRSPRARLAARWIGLAAYAAHTVAILARWISTGHAPVMGAYENALTGAWFLPLIFAVVVRQYRPAIAALPLVLAATLLLLGNGITSPATLGPLESPYRSGWLVVHVAFAWFGFGSYVLASALAAYYLWSVRPRAAPPAGEEAAPPSTADAIDELTAKVIAFGFVSHSIMIASGAIWAHGLWGRYWAWDPVETWSLVTWLVYGIYLHLRFTLGWRGRRAAWVALVAVASILVTFFGLGVVTSVHTELL